MRDVVIGLIRLGVHSANPKVLWRKMALIAGQEDLCSATNRNTDESTCLADQNSFATRGTRQDSNPRIPDRLQLVPQRCSKTVHFIRHGEGFHNIGYEGNVDAHLTPMGWHQAAALGKHIRSLQPPLNIEVMPCCMLCSCNASME